MKYFVLFAFVAIIGSLGAALVFMMKGSADEAERTKKMARSLAMRVGFSVLLFAAILLAWLFGVIQPTGRI